MPAQALPAQTLPAPPVAGTLPTAAPTPRTPSFVVAVIGDTLAQWLAGGLSEAYVGAPDVTIVSRARDSSGLVREDFYDWPKALRELVAGNHLDALVVMIGSNDRQPLRGPAGLEEPLSTAWDGLYAKRIDALIGIAQEKKIPLVWVGLPIVKNDRYAQAVDAINAIERARTEASGGRFVDVFDAFADEKGQYSAFGPDVNGQIVKLRAGDGIHFTPAGARKLAHFVEGEIRHLRDAKTDRPRWPLSPRSYLARSLSSRRSTRLLPRRRQSLSRQGV